MSKEYGLIIPNKNKIQVQAPVKRAAIFDEDSDSDDGAPKKPMFFTSQKKKQTEITHERALEEDPTVYQYDEVYDDIQQKKMDSKLLKKDLDRKPKYIHNLLKAAEMRKRENERRIERQVQKEREAEGDQFKDKESFVTRSYQTKLEEMKALEEQERREEYLESIGDVTKQGNLDGFYRHLYEQKVKYEDTVEEPQVSKAINTEKSKKKRHYRSRKESDDEEVEIKQEHQHLQSNLDADSDFSIDSSSESESNETEVKPPVVDVKEEKVIETKNEEAEKKEEKPVETEEKIEEIKVAKKERIYDFKKRTVGAVFEEARKRYFARREAKFS